MAKRSGPPRKPPKLRAIAGTDYKKGKMDEHLKLSAERAIVPPETLSSEELKIWNCAVEELKAYSILDSVDVSALFAYCVSFSLFINANHELKLMSGEDHAGLMIPNGNGSLVTNPLVTIRNKAAVDMVNFATQLGMTPASRLKLNAQIAEQKVNPFLKNAISNEQSKK